MSIMKKSLVWIAILLIVATGCANPNNNQMGQQNVRDNNRGPQMLRDQNNGDDWNNGRTGNADNRRAGRDGVGTLDNRIEIADKAAEKITNLKGVNQANVLVTRRNAYVAAVLDTDQQKLTKNIEDQIANQVRKVDPDIQNVYVSTNPEFVERINGYVGDVQEGRPVTGFMEQFNEIAARIFPNAR
ncbi:MAG: YhcN/YlaJ family sporulation lipoprotein [Bacillota bacterium]